VRNSASRFPSLTALGFFFRFCVINGMNDYCESSVEAYRRN
jgi:hypothetical protein